MSIMVKFMSIIGKFEKQNRLTFWELLKSIIGKKRSIIDSGLLITQMYILRRMYPFPRHGNICDRK